LDCEVEANSSIEWTIMHMPHPFVAPSNFSSSGAQLRKIGGV